MPNKIPWFPHDHDAGSDEMLQQAMDQFGHLGYAAYFLVLELIHKHGVDDHLTMRLPRLAKYLRTKDRTALDLLTFFTSYRAPCGDGGGNVAKIIWERSGNDVHIRIPNIRKWWANQKSKIISTSSQLPRKVPVYIDRDKEKNIHSPERLDEFEQFYAAYPRRIGKKTARNAWIKQAENGLPPLDALLAALGKQIVGWPDPKFIPYPATWINGHRWSDEVVVSTVPSMCFRCSSEHAPPIGWDLCTRVIT